MELQSSKRQRHQQILVKDANGYEHQPIPEFNHHQIEHLSIHQLNLWKDVYVNNNKRQNENNLYGEVNLGTHQLFPLMSSIQSNEFAFEDVAVANNTQKMIEEVMLDTSKSAYELQNLFAMTRMLLSGDSNANGIIKAYPKSGKESKPICWDQQQQQQQQQPTYVDEIIEHKQKIFGKCHQILSKGMAETTKAMREGNVIQEQIKHLSKSWRLSAKATDRYRKNIEGAPVYSGEYVSIDCSYASLGDNPLSIFEYLVPLKIHDSFSVLALHPKEMSRPMTTLSVVMRFIPPLNENGNKPQPQVISSITAWDIVNKPSISLLSPIEIPLNSSRSLEMIHAHCLRRKHEALCQRLFNLLRSDALNKNDRWSLDKLSHEYSTLLPDTKSISMSCDDELQQVVVMDDEVFTSALNIKAIHRNKIVIAMSSNIELEISLIPNEDVVSYDWDVTSLPTVTDDSTHMNVENEKPTTSTADESINNNSWLGAILSNCVLMGQLKLLHRFKDLHSQHTAQNTESESVSSATTSSNPSSISRVPAQIFSEASLEAMTKSSLSFNQHIRLDTPLLGPLDDIGNKKVVLSKEGKAEEGILRSITDLIKVGIYYRSLKNLLTKLSDSKSDLSSLHDFTVEYIPMLTVPGTSILAEQWNVIIYKLEQGLKIKIVLSKLCATVTSAYVDMHLFEDNEKKGHEGIIHPVNTRFESFADLRCFVEKVIKS